MSFGSLFQHATTFLDGFPNSVLFFVLSFIVSVCFIWCKIPSGLREKACSLLYVGSSLFVLFSFVDPVCVTVGFDIMALAAMMLIALGGNSAASGAFITYACVHFVSGALLMVGACQGAYLGFMEGMPRVLFISGLLINAAAFPLSFWVPYTYPKASRSGIIILSTFTTKIAVFVLLMMITEGELAIQYVGIATVLYGVLFAILAKDIRLVMSYGVVGNVGLLLIAVGCGRDVLPADLVVMQMALSVMYQTLLFVVVDSVACDTSRLRRGELWLSTVCCGVALLNLCAFPGTASYIVKSALLHVDTDNFNYAILKSVYPTLGLLLFMAIGVKFYWIWMKGYERNESAAKGFRGLSIAAFAAILLLLGMPGVWRSIFPEYGFTYSLSDLISKTIGVAACVACYGCLIHKCTDRWDFSPLKIRIYKALSNTMGWFSGYFKDAQSLEDDSSKVVNICTGSVSLKQGAAGATYTASSTVLWSMLFILIMFMVWIYV